MKRILLIMSFCGVSCLLNASSPANNEPDRINTEWPNLQNALSINLYIKKNTCKFEELPAAPQLTPQDKLQTTRKSDIGITRPAAPVADASSNNGSPVHHQSLIASSNLAQSLVLSAYSTAPCKRHKRAASLPASHKITIEKPSALPALAAVAARSKSADEKPQHKTQG